ncbi:pollen-specific leucine-rich repeat extensin-like protein 1 [Selaginella moellendorffii]|uniref:pollen-specific leucine-rich repeat extensin-like protein 1 n=1 Tax=Selaginella moellendorffii TaxID=88036 RepID=UPI000D1C4B96|nr:pollen-specific leucine-rich repeat extensin-like protein 1 [Selaginella moellendorffii]|eukprot:XP_024516086.1 pollen-specific leucine-rich repeat extensin-like protein 1 [Selaginella moellendorffii]
MDKGNASWEQVHRILFPGGPVPVSLLDASSHPHSGAGLLGPPPGMKSPFEMLPDFGNSLQGGPPLAPPRPPLADPRLVTRREDSLHFFAIPPPVPRDPKMLHHIKLFAAFVAKFGVENESLVRAKQQGKSEFSFLYGGEPGSEASIGRHYYEWQKEVMLKVLEARKAVSEGKIPPDRLRSMQRELEQCLQGVQTLRDFRLEAIIGLPENGKLDWQKIALEVGVPLPGERRPSFAEPSEKDKMAPKPQMAKPVMDAPTDPRRNVKTDRTRGGAGRRDEKEAKEEFPSPGNRRRRRSRSRSPERDRHRPRSPSHRNHSPRRRGRSHSRSPRRRERFQSKRDADERKDDSNNNKLTHHHHQPGQSLQQQPEPLPLEALPFASQHVGHILAPPPQPPANLEHPPGFAVAADNTTFARYITAPLMHDSQQGPPLPPQQQQHHFASISQDPGLPRVPGSYPQVGAAFAPALSEIPAQQQQFLLQQLQLSHIQSQLSNGPLGPQPPPPPPPPWSSGGEVLPLEVHAPPPQHFVGLVGGQPPPPPPPSAPVPAIFLRQQPGVSAEKYDPLQPTSSSNDVEMEVEGGSSPKAAAAVAVAADEEPEVVNSKLEVAEAGSKRSSEAAATSKEKDHKEKDHHKEEDGDEDGERLQKERSEKDGRALKVVRNTVAEFVKELLNPKWRDGVLSKDDFKVIAQKAVNKVVGNLQGSQIPKGTERVDRFMASSKDKIVKLVQEYVEKHTKNAPAPSSTAATAEEDNGAAS